MFIFGLLKQSVCGYKTGFKHMGVYNCTCMYMCVCVCMYASVSLCYRFNLTARRIPPSETYKTLSTNCCRTNFRNE